MKVAEKVAAYDTLSPRSVTSPQKKGRMLLSFAGALITHLSTSPSGRVRPPGASSR
jgi:hypothetical protein